jgi:hypothetical protein
VAAEKAGVPDKAVAATAPDIKKRRRVEMVMPIPSESLPAAGKDKLTLSCQKWRWFMTIKEIFSPAPVVIGYDNFIAGLRNGNDKNTFPDKKV